MKIPSKFRITSKVSYQVLYVKSFEDKEGEKTYAECDPNKKQIVLSEDQSDTEMIKSVIHEFFHALEFENNFKIPHKIIHLLEGAILKVLRLNKWI